MLLYVAATARIAAADDVAAPPEPPEPPEPKAERWDMLAHSAGSPNDPITPYLDRYLAVRTRDGFAIEGGEAPLFLDGYRILTRQGDGTPIVTAPAIRQLWLETDGDVMYGDNGTLDLSSGRSPRGAELSTREVALYLGSVTLRLDTLGLAIPHFIPADRELAFESAPTSVGLQVHGAYRTSPELWLAVSAMATLGGVTYFTDRTDHADQRVHVKVYENSTSLEEHYHRGPWHADLSQAFGQSRLEHDRGVVQHDDRGILAFETRDELRRDLGSVAGLTEVTWSLGGEAHLRRYDLDIVGAPEDRENVPRVVETPFDDASHAFEGIVWTPDFAGSTAIVAHLSSKITSYLGLRLDAFGTDLTLEPRGVLLFDLGHLRSAQLLAGAYRRAPEQGEELEHDLHPERTSRIAFQVGQGRAGGERGFEGYARVYYDDRTRLIEDDGLGNLANTGTGTTYGVFALASEHLGHWLGEVSIALESSERQDRFRTRVRPYEYDQPVRLDARLQRRQGTWLFGAHFSLREGLPSTPVTGAIYDSDRDVYLPQLGSLYTERLPWHHQLDLRIDCMLTSGRVKLSAYLDVANVYDHRGAIGWAYNFDYTQRRAIEGPSILPTLGLRGQL